MRSVLRFGLLLLLVVSLPGCLVGILVADPPNTPRSKPPLKLDKLPVYFATCDPEFGISPCPTDPDVERAKLALRRVLVGEHGTLVQEGQPPADSPYVYYRLSVLPPVPKPSEASGSWILSYLTFSIIPGYYARTYPMDVFVEVSEPPAAPVSKWYRYEMKLRAYIWLPFIVAPDVLLTLVGGETDTDLRKGTEDVIRRLAYDTGTMLQGAGQAGK